LEPNPAETGSQPLPAPPAPAGTHSFRLENDKPPAFTSLQSIETISTIIVFEYQNESLLDNTDHEIQEPDGPFSSSFEDLIPVNKLSKPSVTTAGTLSSPSVPSGNKPPRHYTPAQVASFLDMAVDEAALEGREIDPRVAKWAQRMEKCGNGAFFVPNPETGQHEIRNFRRCGVRFCPICMWRKSIRFACQHTPRIEQFLKENPTHTLRLVTLTDRQVPMSELKAQCARLAKAFSRFCEDLSHGFVGYLRATDIGTCWRDPCPQKNIHDHWEAPMEVRPHIHAIIVQRPKNKWTYVKNSQIKEVWATAMGSPILLDTHAKPINTSFGAAKYVAKGVDWKKVSSDYNYLAELAVALDGIRCVNTGGVLRRKAFS
jgi:hypothetical protein